MIHQTIAGHLYDYPKYYDLVFGSDWVAEYQFLLACFERYASGKASPVKRLFEPACGTGRLLWKFAKAGYEIAGNDLNAHAVEYCNARLIRNGLPATAFVGDMAEFCLPKKVDAAFNTINSFRHLLSEATAVSHMQSVAEALKQGGLYILGLHLTPTVGTPIQEESWPARRGNLAVLSHMRSEKIDLARREETVCMSYDVYTPTRSFRLEDSFKFRTYTASQMDDLFHKVPSLEVVETFDFTYEMEQPIEVGPETEDVLYILRKR